VHRMCADVGGLRLASSAGPELRGENQATREAPAKHRSWPSAWEADPKKVEVGPRPHREEDQDVRSPCRWRQSAWSAAYR
jgi:hypothetical protein